MNLYSKLFVISIVLASPLYAMQPRIDMKRRTWGMEYIIPAVMLTTCFGFIGKVTYERNKFEDIFHLWSTLRMREHSTVAGKQWQRYQQETADALQWCIDNSLSIKPCRLFLEKKVNQYYKAKLLSNDVPTPDTPILNSLQDKTSLDYTWRIH